jgi:hypothetical protein
MGRTHMLLLAALLPVVSSCEDVEPGTVEGETYIFRGCSYPGCKLKALKLERLVRSVSP